MRPTDDTGPQITPQTSPSSVSLSWLAPTTAGPCPGQQKCVRACCERSSPRCGPAGLWFAGLRDLGNEFVDNRFAKALEILCHHDESARAADDIGAVITIEPAGWIGVLRIPGQWRFTQDREPIDCDSLRHGLIAQFGHIAAGIVGARHRKYRWSAGVRQTARARTGPWRTRWRR